MSEKPVSANTDVVSRARRSPLDCETLSTNRGTVFGMSSKSTAHSRLGNVSSSSEPQQSIKDRQRRRVKRSDDLVMNSLKLRFESLPRGQMYAKVPSAVKRASPPNAEGNPLSSDAGQTIMAVQKEVVGMVSRFLPRLTDGSTPEEPGFLELLNTTQENVADDRITPQTLQKLFQKGRIIASRMSAKRKFDIQREERPFSPKAKVDLLRTQVDRLEPPYLDLMLQAKICDATQGDNDATPREVLPITAKQTENMRQTWREAQRYHSPLLAPPPSRAKERRLERHLSSLSFLKDDSAKDRENTLVTSLTRSTAVGDDVGIIDQVVTHAAKQRRPDIGGSTSSDVASGIPQTHPSYAPIFSTLDAVLSVSKEYEKLQQTWPGGDAAKISASRHAIIDRITSWRSSLIPRSLWITVHNPTFPGARPQLQEEDNMADGVPHKSSLIFPALNATGRAQVYLLAATLDRMLEDVPDALAVLADKEIAQRLLPQATAKESSSLHGASADVERIMSPTAIKESDNAHLQYVEAAEKVLEIANVGLVELVRQVGSSCAERGALLDAFRLLFTDLTSSCLWLLGYCKTQARREAESRQNLIDASRKDVEELIMLREKVRLGRQEVAMLRQENNELEHKASKYDTLLERLQLKDKNFSRHPVDQHLRLLMDLEDAYTELTTKGLEELYEHQKDELYRDEEVVEAPTTHMANHKHQEEETAREELYTESYRLLKALTDAMDTVDTTCQPLYEHLSLPFAGETVNVASMRWAKIARSVGSYEVEKKHRRRVFDVFAQWNGMQEKPGTNALENLDTEGDGEKAARAHIAMATVPSSKSSSPLSSNVTDEEGSSLTAPKMEFRKCAKLITKRDLIEMDVTDCSPDEVNALYDPDFDLSAYLRPEYTLPEKYTMDTKVLRDMVHDVTESLAHITLRVKSLANSKLVKECMNLPIKPPTRPHDACTLCGRLDHVAIEKKNRGEAMQRVALEIQRRYDELAKKCQKAEADCDGYRKEVQRLQMQQQRSATFWEKRDADIREGNAALMEENKYLMQRAFGRQKTPSDDNASRGNTSHASTLRTLPPNGPEVKSNFADNANDGGESGGSENDADDRGVRPSDGDGDGA